MIKKIKEAIEGKKSSYFFKIILLQLWPLSLLYRFIVTVKTLLFKHGILLKKELPCKVICVGNVTTGGTGKTPAVIKIVKTLQSMEKKVAVISRGYGGSYKGVKTINPDQDDSADVGDEPLLMARQLDGVPVVVSSDRYEGGLSLCGSGRYDFIILDDGFQHLRLNRDLDFVLIDSNLPFGNGHLLPMGILREPLSALKRADAFILTRLNISSNINNLCSFLAKNNPEAPIFKSSHKPVGLRVLEDDVLRDEAVDFIKEKKIIAFAGIANPDSFFEMIIGMGGIILEKKAFGDHMAFEAKDLELLDGSAVRENCLRQGDENTLSNGDVTSKCNVSSLPEVILMTTEKDMVRINNFKFKSTVAILKIELSIEREDKFVKFITDRL